VWQPALSEQLAGDETVLGWFEPDLDETLMYARGLVVLSDRRLLSRAAGDSQWRSWPLEPDQALRHHDHAGAGSLELSDPDRRLACWRYTIGQHAALLRFVDAFARAGKAARAGRRAQPVLLP